jgi:hypothetical protein
MGSVSLSELFRRNKSRFINGEVAGGTHWYQQVSSRFNGVIKRFSQPGKDVSYVLFRNGKIVDIRDGKNMPADYPRYFVLEDHRFSQPIPVGEGPIEVEGTTFVRQMLDVEVNLKGKSFIGFDPQTSRWCGSAMFPSFAARHVCFATCFKEAEAKANADFEELAAKSQYTGRLPEWRVVGAKVDSIEALGKQRGAIIERPDFTAEFIEYFMLDPYLLDSNEAFELLKDIVYPNRNKITRNLPDEAFEDYERIIRQMD